MKKIRQKKLIVILFILLIIGIFFIIKYSINDSYISGYNNKEYNEEKVKKLLFLNIQEKYIAHFNYGTSLYQNGKYDEAKKEFNEALVTVPKKRVCAVRVNIALSEIKLLDKEVKVSEIERIQKILLGNDCATKDHKGKDKKAQELYDELEKSKENASQGQGDGDDDDGEEENNGEDVIENEEDKINQIKENNKNAANGRNPSNDRDYNPNNYRDAVW